MKKTLGAFTLIAALTIPTMAQAAQNPSSPTINKMLTDTAKKYNIPPEVLKGVAMQESGWRQFDEKGAPLVAEDNGIGIMQVTMKQSNISDDSLKNDIAANIEEGALILNTMYNRSSTPKVTGDRQDIEDWFFAVIAYNGMVPSNSPVVQQTGALNEKSYGQKVYGKIYRQDFSNTGQHRVTAENKDVQLMDILNIRPTDVTYYENPAKMVFQKSTFEPTSRVTRSNYALKVKDRVLMTAKGVKLRTKPSTVNSAEVAKLAQYERVTITGPYVFDTQQPNNRFVWYPVQTSSGQKGYIASAYMQHTYPMIETRNVTMYAGENVTSYVRAIDAEDGDISKYVTANFNSGTPGVYNVPVTVRDSSAKTTIETIHVTVKPAVVIAKPKVKALKALGGKKVKVTIASVKGAVRYDIQYATNKNIKNAKTVKTTATSKTLTKLTKKKRYYVRVRAYVTVNGKAKAGAYGAVKTIVAK